LRTGNGEVRAADVIVATYDPFNHPKETRFKKGMYVSYVLEAVMDHGAIREGIYEDMANPYHYLRADKIRKNTRLIFGGEDHRIEIPMDQKKNFKALEKHFRDLIPAEAAYTITREWTGPILETMDGLPFIGSLEKHLYLATGFSGNGMTYAMIAAEMFLREIVGGLNPWRPLYEPGRVPSLRQLMKKGGDYTGALFGGALKNSLEQK
jgi:glycine/D-amino acid oxidase-like deaminating enzyme